MLNATRNLVFVVAGLALLAGCGGGDNDDGNQGPIVGDLVTITSQNAPTIAGVAAEVALEDGVFGTVASQGLPIGSTGTGTLLAISGILNAPLPPEILAAQMTMAPCAVDGTVDLVVSISNPEMLTLGDEFRLTFNACDDGIGTVTNGTLIMTVTAFQGDLAGEQFVLGMSVALQGFSVTQDGQTTSASGSISIEIDTMTPPLTTITVSTTALTTTTAGTSETVSNMTVTITEDNSMFPAAVSVATSFRFSSPRIGGDVIVSTSLALQSSGEEYPFVGELRIEGAGNSVIVLIALDSNSVRLEIDIDGDGAMDETMDTTWDEILAAAQTG